jgi:putative thioredoxin
MLNRGVVLAKVNVDEEAFIAAQFQVRSIPTVYAMFQGQPVADLTNARTESQLRQCSTSCLPKLPVTGGPRPAQDVAPLIAMGDEVLAEAAMASGRRAFSRRSSRWRPNSAQAQAGLVRALAMAGRLDEAEAALAALDPALRRQSGRSNAPAALDLAKARPDDSELAALRQAAEATPDDMEAQFAFATAALPPASAMPPPIALLAMIAKDREWNEGAAKAKLLQMFEAIGLEDPWVAATRRRLSLILFG